MVYAIHSAEIKRIALDDQSRSTGKLAQHVTVLDMYCPMGILNAWMAPGVKKFVTTMMTAMQKHYPEFTRKVMIINAPMAFSAIWSGIKLGLPQRILDKARSSTLTPSVVLDSFTLNTSHTLGHGNFRRRERGAVR